MQRITERDLDATIALVNRLLPGTDAEPYVLDFAYGAVAMVRQLKGGGQVSILPRSTKRELYHLMHAFAAGAGETTRKGGQQ